MAGQMPDIKTAIRRLFRYLEDFFYGFEMTDISVKNESGKSTQINKFRTNIDGNAVNLTCAITATNIGKVFQPYIDFINDLSLDEIKKNYDKEKGKYKADGNTKFKEKFGYLTGIELLTASMDEGSDDYEFDESSPWASHNDISLDHIKSVGKGLLGTDILNASSVKDLGPWADIALKDLKYDLYCETDGNDDSGKVSGIQLPDCVKWIKTYMDHIKGSTNRQLSHEEKVKNEKDKESTVSSSDNAAISLVKDVLVNIQEQLRKVYQDKLNSDLSLDNLIKQPKEEEEPTSENPEDEEKPKEGTSEETSEGGSKEEDMSKGVKESKHINMKLRKVQASIDLLALESNFAPGDTLNYVDDIINQDEFTDILTEEPQSYSIDIAEDGYEIEQCPDCCCDACKILGEVFLAAIQAYRNMYIIHWMSSGNDMMKTHLLAEEMYEELIKEIDTLGELLVEKCGNVPSLDFPCEYIDVKNYGFQDALDAIKLIIEPYIDVIDYSYPNQDSDVQSTLDEWLRYWNKQLNYFVKRQEV